MSSGRPSGREMTAPLAMVIGPRLPAPSVLARLAEPPPALTDPRFLAEVAGCVRGIRELIGARAAPVVVAPGSGTSGMESVAVSLLDPAEPVLVASTGMWGDRWARICARHRIPVHALTAPAGRAPDLDLLAAMLVRGRCRAVLVSDVDSSSGVRAPLREIAALAREHGALCLVDGVAAIGADRIEFDEWGLDVYLGAPPKGLAAPPGLFTVALGPRAERRLPARSWTPRAYALDLEPWLPVMAAAEDGRSGYFQTPAVNLVMAFAEAMRLVAAEGRVARAERHVRLRDRLHDGLAALGIEQFVPERDARSAGITVCRAPAGVDGQAFVAAVAAAGVVLQSGTYPTESSSTFRIGHLGNVTESDVDATLTALRVAGRVASRASS